jgi:DNA polymerase III sliding clamp (beta) subunit (PCNA family)
MRCHVSLDRLSSELAFVKSCHTPTSRLIELVVDGDGLQLRSTSAFLELSSRLEALVGRPGRVIVPSILETLVGTLQHDVSLEVDRGKLVVTSGENVSLLLTVALMPDLEAVDTSETATMPAELLRKLLSATAAAAGDNADAAIMVEFDDEAVKFVATDRRRCVIAASGEPQNPRTLKIPVAIVSYLRAMVGESKEPVVIGFTPGANAFFAQCANRKLKSLAAAGTLPDYKRISSFPAASTLTFAKGDFRTATRRVGSFVGRERSLLFSANHDGLLVQADDIAKEVIPAELTGEPFQVRLATGFVLDALNGIDGDVTFEFAGKQLPAAIVGKNQLCQTRAVIAQVFK